MNNTLSAGELLDVELGLYVLSELFPQGSSDTFPLLFSDTLWLKRPIWSLKQHRIYNRAKQLLGHLGKKEDWDDLIESYMAMPDRLRAFEIWPDRSLFQLKGVGFFRNRIATLKSMLLV